MEWLASPEIWVAFLTLTALEIVLGIDNIIFISILVGRLPPAQQPKARFFGLALAMGTRILLLLSITWVMRLTTDLFHLFGQGISGRDLILFFGGLFLLFKGTMELHERLEGREHHEDGKKVYASFAMVVAQIVKHVDGSKPVRFLIAETETGYTLLAALWLARLCGIENHVEISPLFETRTALERGAEIVAGALAVPAYRDYLRGRGRSDLARILTV